MEIVVTGSGEDDELAALVHQARTGNTAAFDQLARRVRARVRRWARVLVGDGDEAEDVTQVVLVRVHERLTGFEGRSRFASWLYRMAGGEDRYALKGEVLTEQGSVRVRVWLGSMVAGTYQGKPIEAEPLLSTGLTVPIGQTIVLGSAAPGDRGQAVILTIRPEVAMPSGRD